MVVLLHEGGAVTALEDGTLAAHRLGDEEGTGVRVVERGRMELHEFHVGDGRPGTVGHGDAVAGGDVRVAGVEVHLAGAAGGKKRDARREGAYLAALSVEHVGAQAAVFLEVLLEHLRLGDKVDGDVVLVDGDVVVIQDRLHQGALDLAAGDVLGVQDAPRAVTALAGQVVGVAALGELDTPVDQVADDLGPFLDHHAHHVLMADTGTGHQRVLHVGVEGVLLGGYGGDAPLGVVGGGFGNVLLGDQGDPAVSGGLQREGKPRDTATDHKKISFLFHYSPP